MQITIYDDRLEITPSGEMTAELGESYIITDETNTSLIGGFVIPKDLI